MQYFPVFLDLRGKSCLVAGAGQVGRRKISRLLQAGPARITVLDPGLDPDLLPEPGQESKLILLQREFCPEDLQGVFLVFACTGDAGTNSYICGLCQERDILCNSANQAQESGFILPAMHSAGDLQIAVSTSGKSPALAAQIKKEVGRAYGWEYALWLRLLGRIRSRLLQVQGHCPDNREIFRSLLDQGILQALQNRDETSLQAILHSKLPRELRPWLGEFTDGLL
ncbi:MAG: precorrin-2 dehydrogenase/sirohydrochlorin ferrochelatase family protein [Thermodesulfobacteriota bacterium]